MLTTNKPANLGVVMDSDLFDQSANPYLKNSLGVKGITSEQDLEKLAHAFALTRLNYCNDAFTGYCKNYIKIRPLPQSENVDLNQAFTIAYESLFNWC